MREPLINGCCYISLCLCFLSIFLGGKDMITLAAVMMSLPYYSCIYADFKPNGYIAVTLFLMFVGAIANMLVAPNGIGGAIVVVGVFSLSHFIVKKKEELCTFFFLMTAAFLLLIAYKIIYKGEDPNFIYPGRSRNYFGLVLSLLNCIYSYLYYLKNKKSELLISFLSLAISLSLIGRTTIGVMAALFLINLLCYFRKSKKMLLFIIMLAVTIAIYYWEDIEQMYAASNFGGFGLDTPRFETWEAFFDSIDFSAFIVGVDVTKIPAVAEYQGNLHNEFLNLLARTGIGALPFYFLCLLTLRQYVVRKEWYLLFLFCFASFRAFFDTGVFVNILGICFYPLIFNSILKSNKRNKNYSIVKNYLI